MAKKIPKMILKEAEEELKILESSIAGKGDMKVEEMAKAIQQRKKLGAKAVKRELDTEAKLAEEEVIGERELKEAFDERMPGDVGGSNAPSKILESPATSATTSATQSPKRTLESIKNARLAKEQKVDIDAFNSGNAASMERLTQKMREKSVLGENENLTQKHIEDYYKSSNHEANLMDKATYHRVPQIAAGGLTTAFLVSSMSGRKGELSNSELYGQQSPYQN